MSHNELDENGEEYIIWDDAQRIWPNEMATLSTSIPQLIRDSLTEARACLSIDARNGSVVLTGRAVEAIARHFNDNSDAKRILLGPGLKELYDKNVIDERLYRWGREIQEHRNIAAHPAPDDLSELDAEDLLTFAEAMCEYVFVLQERYNAFLTRKRSRRESASGPVNV